MTSVGGERVRAMFLPCVLDRLTDYNPESREENLSRAVSVNMLRRSILENLALILNSRSHPRSSEMASGLVRDSVLGLGLEDFCGLSHSRERRELLRKDILRQLRLFEPRLARDSLEVSLIDAGASAGAMVEFEIRGRIGVAPLAQEFVFRAWLNLESGEVGTESSE